MKILILILTVLGVSAVSASTWQGPKQEICNVQASYVNDMCSKFEDQALKNCLVTEMEVQDFYHKDDFIIDSDLTVLCLPEFWNNNFTY